jgi:4-amino-4-deoxy-L-arabinose transferase-like glycosyltransferase
MLAAPMIALGSACGFAVSTSLQHLAASRVAPSAGALRLLTRLATNPLWLAASVLGLVSFSLHAVALHLGSLALVQPLMLCGVVLAVPVRAAAGRRRPGRQELLAVCVTVAGLASFLAATEFSPGRSAPDTGRALLYCALVGAAFAVLMMLASRQRRLDARGALLGAASGLLFGAMAGLIKLVAHDLQHGGLATTLSTWRPWVLALAGLMAVSTNQRAFHSARLAASMPLLNVVNVAVAMTFGWFVFGEAPVQGPLTLAVQVVAGAVTALGLAWIAMLDPDDPDHIVATPSDDPVGIHGEH